jgi:hypothetical protein
MTRPIMKRVKLVPHDSTDSRDSRDSRESIEMDEYSDEDDEVFLRHHNSKRNGDTYSDSGASRPLMKKRKKGKVRYLSGKSYCKTPLT